MALLDPLFRAVAAIADTVQGIGGPIGNPTFDRDPETELGEGRAEADDLTDEAFAGFFDTVEDEVIEEILEKGALTPENVEEAVNEAEGNALAISLAAVAGNLGIELAGGTQLESHQFLTSQILAFLALEDVLGRRLGTVYEKGVDPALQADVAKQTRSEFVALPDAVEALLRAKQADEGWLTGENVDERWAEAVGSNEPVNPENLVEEWGIRDDNLEILEWVSLEAMEFEELIETPAELGLIVDDEVLELVLDLAGYPEPLKDFLREVPEAIPRSNRLWEEKTAVEPAVEELEVLTRKGEISPTEAVARLPAEVDEAKPALEDRFRQVADLPNTPPTASDVEGSFTWGLTDRAEYEERLDRLDIDPEKYDDIVDTVVLDAADGQLQEAFALGLIDENRYSTLLRDVGLDEEAIGQLLAGQSLSDITEQRLQEQAEPGDLDVTAIGGIGSSRGSGLRAVGIETVQDLAGATVETVAEAAQVSEEVAQGFISAATLRTE